MFELENAIAGWKRRLAATGSCTGDSLAELESHLRDSHASLAARGLSSEESFLIAARRLGDAGSLQAEYAKEHSIWRDRLLWMLTGVLAFQFLIVLATLLRDVGTVVAIAAGVRGSSMILLAIAITLAGYAAVFGSAFALRGRAHAALGARPVPCIVAAVSFIIVGTVLSRFSFSAAAYFLKGPDMGNLATFTVLAGLASAVLVPLVFGIAIARLRPTTGATM